ncbi:MAG: M20/M25/M40 family metallo-hydrolase [Candidatus Eiseniibacteriota bacterium]
MRRKRRNSHASLALLVTCVVAFCSSAHADSTKDAAVSAARKWRIANERQILNEHVELVRIQNVSKDTLNIRRNAEYLLTVLEKRGVKARLLEVPGAPPLVYGELLTPGATSTYVFYAHYDGQPVDPKEWASLPFEPTLRTARLDKGGTVLPLASTGPLDPEWRLYARAVSDDKGPITAMMAALDALRSAGIKPRANLKFVFDGEEEVGSPNLDRLLKAHRDLLRGDLWIIGDGPEHPSGRPTVSFGVRGVQGVEITVYGASRELHSGHYGNWAPNPAMMLSRLLASMKDADGRVLIAGFYDDVTPLTKSERAAIDAIPNDDAERKHDLSLSRTDGGGKRLAEMITVPALNVRGLSSGKVGEEAANAIPTTATASIDIRLVKAMDGARTVSALIRHVEKEGYFVKPDEPGPDVLRAHPKVARITVETGGYNAVRTPMELPVAQRLVRALEGIRGPLVLQPTMGGSLPLAVIEEIVGAPTITVPTVNSDNNQHAKNENLRLGNLWTGIETMAALFVME